MRNVNDIKQGAGRSQDCATNIDTTAHCGTAGVNRHLIAFGAAMVVLVGGAIALGTVVSALKIHLKKTPIEVEAKCASLPTESASWKRVGEDKLEDEAMVEVLGTHNYLSRKYVEKHPADPAKPRAVELHLAYYTGMVDTVPHVPERCMVGGGWTIQSGTRTIPLALDDRSWELDEQASAESTKGEVYTARLAMDGAYSKHPGSRVRLPRDPRTIGLRITPFELPGTDQKMFAGYFFIANGGHVSSAEDVRLLAFNLTDDYAYYLKVQVSSVAGINSAEELADAASSLLSEMLPEIMLCVPDWTLVQRGQYPPENPRRKEGSRE